MSELHTSRCFSIISEKEINKRVNLYVVDGPFQLINAIEAKTQLGTNFSRKNILVIRYPKGDVNRRQVENCLKLTEWDSIYFIRPTLINFSTFWKTALLVKKFVRSISIEFLFIGGFYYSTFHLFASNLKPRRAFLLDDGNMSLDIFRKMNEGITFKEVEGSNVQSVVKRIFYYFLRLIIPKNLCYEFFTIFDTRQFAHIRSIKNKFSFLEEKMKSKRIDSNHIYFIGSPLVDIGIIDLEYQNEYLTNLKNLYSGQNKRFSYISHRRESQSSISNIMKLGIDVESFENPIELEFILRDSFPAIICSFHSSALMSLKSICSELEIISYYIPSQFIRDKYREEIESIYISYKKFMRVTSL